MPADPPTSDATVALLLTGPKELSLGPFPAPELAPDHVLVKVKTVGICGSDVSYWSKGKNGLRVIKEPHILGHESAGEIVALGAEVAKEGSLAVGARVAVEPSIGCMKCDGCKRGYYNVCPTIIYGGTPPNHGSFRTLISHPATFIHPLPPSISYEEGAFLQPLSIVVHAIKRVGMKGGDKVFIAGAGPIGTLCALLATIHGARHVTVTDINASRLAITASLVPGLRTIHVTPELLADPPAVAKMVVEGDREGSEGLCEVTLDCVGTKEAVEACVASTGIGGSVLLLGMGGGGKVDLPVAIVQAREIDLKGLLRTRNGYHAAIELVRSGKVDLKKLITHRYDFTLENAKEGFEAMYRGESMKVIFNLDK
ncbi:L-idonate 5-dehydrogenase [Hyaloraphidium curvatum]|nr:L-idonate 5-dehydrogenase [Hyaloraphidium curvatum]